MYNSTFLKSSQPWTAFMRVRKIGKATISFVMSVRPSPRNNTTLGEQIFMKYDTSVFFENMSRTFKFHRNMTRITGTLHEDQYIFLIISLSFLLRIRNVSEKVVEKIKIHFTFNNLSPKIMSFVR